MKLWFALLLMVVTGCAAQKAALCSTDTELRAKATPRPEHWFRLLLHAYDDRTRELPRPTRDCTGTPVVVLEHADECGDAPPSREQMPPRQLTDRDVVVTALGENRRLVWVITRRYAAGDALGIVALVDGEDTKLKVRAIGTLRALPHNTLLRLEKVGSLEVLIAEGERCEDGWGGKCSKAARLVPLVGNRFIMDPIVDEGGRCLGSAWVRLREEHARGLPTGIVRKFEQVATLELKDGKLVSQEQIVVSDLDPKKPKTEARIAHRAEATRVIRAAGGKLIADGLSLWTRVVEPTAVREVQLTSSP